jgi:hypothetical protein
VGRKGEEEMGKIRKKEGSKQGRKSREDLVSLEVRALGVTERKKSSIGELKAQMRIPPVSKIQKKRIKCN